MKRITIVLLVIAIMFMIMGCSSESLENTKESSETISETEISIIETQTETERETKTENIDETVSQENEKEWWWEGEKLSVDNPEVEGPSGIETFFNEDVSKLVENAKEGYIGEYWVRSDGVKMFGEYIICKCKYESNEYHPTLPVGTVIPTTIGVALVCSNETEEDICIAVTW